MVVHASIRFASLPVTLRASGFPAGSEELGQNSEQLANILVVDKAGAGGPVPNYSLVQVGCLAQSADNAWILTNSTEPVRARETGDSKLAELQGSESRPLGDRADRPRPRALMLNLRELVTHASFEVMADSSYLCGSAKTNIVLLPVAVVSSGVSAR
jgi:hypothetical protein